MKKLSTTLLAVVIASAVFFKACEEAERLIAVLGIELNQSSVEMSVGTTLTLVPTISPADASNPAIRWESTDTTVATVDAGTVTAIAPGVSTVMAITVDGGRIARSVITVTDTVKSDTIIPVTGVALGQTTATVGIGQFLVLTATILPENATNQNVIWTSSNPTVASVLNGTVIGLTPGTTVITVTTQCGGMTASCVVTAVPAVPVVHIELDRTIATIYTGETVQLIPTVFPENATNQTVNWLSTNPAVATVVDGLVTAVSGGSATIVATTEDGNHSATCVVTVRIPVEGVTLNEASATLTLGDNLWLVATVYPVNASNQNVIWSSDNTAVATVNSNGGVTAISAGTATITATTQDRNFTATSTITTLYAPATGVTVNPTTVTIYAIGRTATLTASVLPWNASQNVTWTSNNPAVATVNDNGVVTAVGLGSVAITATTADGDNTATSVINVPDLGQLVAPCNNNVPGWGNNLGVISFYTSQTWTITGNGISQIWSDAVTATNCQKTTFDGGNDGGWPADRQFADCRSNPDFPGDLFSWCAVVRFADQLCPYPWRVPTPQDFTDLDIAMGGTGEWRSPSVETAQFVQDNYIAHWGGRFGGLAVEGIIHSQDHRGLYWSSTRSIASSFEQNGEINPQSAFFNRYGGTLRCVQ